MSNLAKNTNLTAPIFPRKDRCGEGVQFWPKMFLNEAAFVVYIRCVYTHNTLRMISFSFQQRMDKIELDVNTMKTMIQEMKTMMAQAHSLQIKQTEVSKGKWNALGQD